MDVKRMSRVGWVSVLAALFALPAAAQEIGVQARNQLEASHDTETEQDIFEDWFDLDLYGDGFQIGLRYSSFSPPDPQVSNDQLSSEGITHRYAEIELGDSRLRAGNFTYFVGRGLSFRSYENRDLRTDTNLDGLLIEHSTAAWRGALFSGRAASVPLENGVREHENRFSGVDLSRDYGLLRVGGAFLSVDRISDSARPILRSLRASIVDGPLQVDWEGAQLLHDDEEIEDGIGNIVEASLLFGPFSVYAGYKHYERVSLLSGSNPMNQPPVLIHDQRATLLGRHPHRLDPDDEKGYLLDLSASTAAGNFLISHSETEHLDGVLGLNSFRESFVEWDRSGLIGLDQVHAIVDFQQVPFSTIAGWSWDYFFSTAVDVHFAALSGDCSLIWEHQHKSADHVGEYDDEILSAEYTAPAGWTLSLIGEYVGWSKEQQLIELEEDGRKIWKGIQLATPLGDRHDLRIFAGGRREGFVCVGGVCRLEPALDGVELMLSSRF